MKNNASIVGLLSGFFWAVGLTISSFLFLKYDISPFVVSMLHDFFSIIFLYFLIIIKYKKLNFKIFSSIKNYTLVLAAILAGPIGMQLNLYSVKYLGANLTSSVTAIYPAVAVLLSIYFLKHRVSKFLIFGILLIVVGLFSKTFEVPYNSSYIYLGVIFSILCALAWASESVLSSYAMENNLRPLEALLIRQITSFVIYVAITLFVRPDFIILAEGYSIYIIVMLMLSNMISYIFYYIAIDKLKPSKATGLNVTYVLWTITLSFIFLNTPLDFKTIITSLIIVLGVYLIIRE